MPVDPWFDEDGEMDIEEVQEDLSFAADLIGVGQRDKANRQRAETNRLLREQQAERKRIKSLPQCWHCGGRLELRGAKICPHCRTELRWQKVRGEKYTPGEAFQIRENKRVLEAKCKAEKEKRNERRKKKAAEAKKTAEQNALLRSTYGVEFEIEQKACAVWSFVVLGGFLLSISCLLSFIIAWLLGFVGWSPAWWTQMHGLEAWGLTAVPVISGVAYGFATNFDDATIGTRLDPKGKSGSFDFLLNRIDLVVGWIQIACWLFILAFTLLSFVGYAPEWWTTLSKGTYYGFLLGPMALSAIYIPITATIASYLRKNNDVDPDEEEVLEFSRECQKEGELFDALNLAKSVSGKAGEREVKKIEAKMLKARYYLRRDKTIKGPLTPAQIFDLAQRKRLKKTDEVSTSENSNFILITKAYKQLKELAHR